jgi:methylenetetrahydrofolate--tRNA-(uracil-5-)-methyltransferase
VQPAPPRTTAIGALAYYVSHANPAHYEPSNITFGIMPELAPGNDVAGPGKQSKNKAAKKQAIADRALADLQTWIDQLKHGRAAQRLPAVHPA